MAMKLKRLLKQWTPPTVLDWYRSLKQYRGFIWEGIYSNYRDVPTLGSGYVEESLTRETLVATRNLMTVVEHHHANQAEIFGEQSFLALIASIHTTGRDKNICVLDFGGGMGIAYVHLLNNAVNNISNIDYHIVENEHVCNAGKMLFKSDSRIHFHSSLPTGLSKVDIVYISSALQYIEDYAGLLNALCAYNPKYFLFVKLSAGDIPTYATAQQNLPGTTVAYWFINVEEIKSLMQENGYTLIYRCLLDREYDQNNFPPKYRLGRACNLLFRRLSND